MQNFVKVYSILFKTLILSIFVSTIATADSKSWILETDGLWLKETKELILLKTNLENHTLDLFLDESKLNSQSYVSDAAKTEKNIAVINASFFDPKAFPLGYISRNGKKLNALHSGGNVLTGIFLLKNNQAKIIPRAKITNFEDSDLAIQAGPRLLVSGKNTLIKSPQQSARSAICITRGKEIILASTQPQARMSLPELQEKLFSEAACHDALNLDGGTSSQILIRRNGKDVVKKLSFASVPVHLVLIDN